MRLIAKKTWSQQELAIKLRVAETDKRGFLTWERRRLLIHAAKRALAAALCWWLASWFGLHSSRVETSRAVGEAQKPESFVEMARR